MFAENRLEITPRLSVVGGVRVDGTDVLRRDLVAGTVVEKRFRPAACSCRATAIKP